MTSTAESRNPVKPLHKVLIANRGEIAIRIARTLRKLGKTSVGVASTADVRAPHTRVVDEWHEIGPAPAAQSYLNAERIVSLARETGCDAVIPGYGFLSENAEFARACGEANLTFIGPPAEAILRMGSKTRSRELMQAAGVPVVPGHSATSVDDALLGAEAIGYPVMIKASAGGGGKGMRLVLRREELARAVERAESEAAKAFGDPTVYLERALVNPRHVEVQVLGDSHGNLLHLSHRACSVQRRHQKIIEEAPCSSLHPETERAMLAAALLAARAVGYYSAGTVEFLVSGNDFYFLEMNTRLQVEHAITELVTGVDLVEEMVRVAEGRPLRFGQDDVRVRGAAVECRVYAEDPERQFVPSPGMIRKLRSAGGPRFREDSGVAPGYLVTPYYDPLLTKLCTWGATRDEAIAEMQRVLRETVVTGIATNLELLERVLGAPAFLDAGYGTDVLTQVGPAERLRDAGYVAVLCALLAHQRSQPAGRVAPEPLGPWRRGQND